ncbi:hypothetical protein ACIRPP_10075 [Streptomyces sp. NPDC101219]|uniref:hypothetical protein n=1 Tax=unclassified Streptomyces TaxID=2593676 RepID=UPI00194104E9
MFGKRRVLIVSLLPLVAGSVVCAVSDRLVPVVVGRRCRAWPPVAYRSASASYVENFSNRKRLRKQPHWGYLTPLEIRQRHEQGHALAA